MQRIRGVRSLIQTETDDAVALTIVQYRTCAFLVDSGDVGSATLIRDCAICSCFHGVRRLFKANNVT